MAPLVLTLPLAVDLSIRSPSRLIAQLVEDQSFQLAGLDPKEYDEKLEDLTPSLLNWVLLNTKRFTFMFPSSFDVLATSKDIPVANSYVALPLDVLFKEPYLTDKKFLSECCNINELHDDGS